MSNEKETKTVIKSLVISSPKGITINQLCKDFRDITGQGIPFRALGYTNVILFLKSIPDTVRIHGSEMNALVIPVVDEKTKHLEAMIQKQRKPTSKTKKRGYRSYFNRQIARPDAIRTTSNKLNDDAPDPRLLLFNNDSPTFSDSFDLNNDSFSSELQQSINFNHSSSFSDHKNDSPNYKSVDRNKAEIKQRNISFNDAATSLSSQSYRTSLKNKLIELVSLYPDGIWCSQLPKLFKQHFGKNLNIQAGGYVSVLQFCSTFPDVLHCVQPDRGDWKVYDVRNPVQIVEDYGDVSSHHPSDEKDQVNTEKALPDINFAELKTIEKTTPDDIVEFGEQIKKQWLIIPKDGIIVVRLTEIFDPSKFWMIMYNEECSLALDQLMNELQTYYLENGFELNIPKANVKVGLYCVGVIYNEYHRGIVVRIEESNVKVFYFDYGTVGEMKIDELKYLHKQFSNLPRQAIRGSLANIKPKDPHLSWPLEATKTFLDLIFDRILIAEIINVGNGEQAKVLNVMLTDTSDSKKDLHINDYLRDKGMAQLLKPPFNTKIELSIRRQKIKKSSYYLLPTHNDLENANYPTLTEISKHNSLGIKPDIFLTPYVFQLSEFMMNEYKKKFHLNDSETTTDYDSSTSFFLPSNFEFNSFTKLQTHIEVVNENTTDNNNSASPLLPHCQLDSLSKLSTVEECESESTTENYSSALLDSPTISQRNYEKGCEIKTDSNSCTSLSSSNSQSDLLRREKEIDEQVNNKNELKNDEIIMESNILKVPKQSNIHKKDADGQSDSVKSTGAIKKNINKPMDEPTVVIHTKKPLPPPGFSTEPLNQIIFNYPPPQPFLPPVTPPLLYPQPHLLSNPYPLPYGTQLQYPFISPQIPFFPYNLNQNLIYSNQYTPPPFYANNTPKPTHSVDELVQLLKKVLNDSQQITNDEQLFETVAAQNNLTVDQVKQINDTLSSTKLTIKKPTSTKNSEDNRQNDSSFKLIHSSKDTQTDTNTLSISSDKIIVKEFAGKKMFVFHINGSVYFSTMQVILQFTKFKNLKAVEKMFRSENLQSPSEMFDLTKYIDVAEQLVKLSTTCDYLKDTKQVHLLKFENVSLLLKKLFSTNENLSLDIQHYQSIYT